MSRIRVSEKHGVNPSLGVCFYCGEDDGTVVLPGRLKNDAQAPHKAVWTRDPCSKCQGYMNQGVILIEVDEKKTVDHSDPYRVGGFAVVRDEAIEKIFDPPELVKDILRKRIAFITTETWNLVGLADACKKPL